jgi:uncharacterized protein (TIGR03905 family)
MSSDLFCREKPESAMTKSKLKGVCARSLSFDLDAGGIVRNVSFKDGCDGNLQALALLAEGRPAAEIVAKLSGIRCGRKSTSCPDQLAQALAKALAAADGSSGAGKRA